MRRFITLLYLIIVCYANFTSHCADHCRIEFYNCMDNPSNNPPPLCLCNNNWYYCLEDNYCIISKQDNNDIKFNCKQYKCGCKFIYYKKSMAFASL